MIDPIEALTGGSLWDPTVMRDLPRSRFLKTLKRQAKRAGNRKADAHLFLYFHMETGYFVLGWWTRPGKRPKTFVTLQSFDGHPDYPEELGGPSEPIWMAQLVRRLRPAGSQAKEAMKGMADLKWAALEAQREERENKADYMKYWGKKLPEAIAHMKRNPIPLDFSKGGRDDQVRDDLSRHQKSHISLAAKTAKAAGRVHI